MKVRNKKTGEIKDVRISRYEDSAPILVSETTPDENGQTQGWPYKSLAELNEEWEDYEEPKEHWYIDWDGKLMVSADEEGWEAAISIGNYFETKEEAEEAVEKLKAWKRLKDKGFRFDGYTSKDRGTITEFEIYCDTGKPCIDRDEFTDLDLLFGGEE